MSGGLLGKSRQRFWANVLFRIIFSLKVCFLHLIYIIQKTFHKGGSKIGFSRSQWNLYDRLTSGFKRCKYQKKRIRFMTLTSVEVYRDWFNRKERREVISEDYKNLVKRLKRVDPLELLNEGFIEEDEYNNYYYGVDPYKKFDFEYCKVVTDEGNGVIHCLYDGEYIPIGWIWENWNELHGASICDIRKVDRDPREAGYYLIKNYLSNQVVRYGFSSNWIYKGWKKDWLELRYKHRKWDSCKWMFGFWFAPIDYNAFYGAWDLCLFKNLEIIKSNENNT